MIRPHDSNTGSRRARSALISLISAVVVLATVSGCSDLSSAISPKDTTTMQHMTPAEARADYKKQVDAIQELLGGEWDNYDSPIAEGCAAASDSGFYYRGTRFRREPIADYDAAGAAAVAYWEARGYEVRSVAYRPTHRLVTGIAPNGTTIYLTLEDNRNRIGAEGPCNEGNWDEVSMDDLRRVQEQRRNTPSPEPTPGE